MLCQTCGAFNDDEREFCSRCQNKLLVLSGVSSFVETASAAGSAVTVHRSVRNVNRDGSGSPAAGSPASPVGLVSASMAWALAKGD